MQERADKFYPDYPPTPVRIPGKIKQPGFTRLDETFILADTMSPDKRLDIQFKSFIRERMLAMLPSDFPSLRELRIQNTKLQRLLTNAVYDSRHILGGGSLKKVKKEIGQQDARIGEQEKKVNTLLERSLKIWLRQNKPEMTNAEFQKWRASFNKGMDDGIKTFRKQVTEKVIEKLAAGE